MLRSEDGELSSLLADIRRKIILGVDPALTIRGESRIVSAHSVARVLDSIVSQSTGELREEGLEIETAPKGNGGNGHANGKDLEEDLQRFLRQRKDKKDDE